MRSVKQSSWRALGVICSLCVLLPALGAPDLRRAGFRAPARARAGEVVRLEVQASGGFMEVLFSGGDVSWPNLPGDLIARDDARGWAWVRVPQGARTGDVQLRVGLSAPLYRFIVDEGAYVRGDRTFAGQAVRGTGVAVPGTVVELLRTGGCEDVELVDVAVADGNGAFTLTGAAGPYTLLVLPPVASGLAAQRVDVVLGPEKAVRSVVLADGTRVTGRVVDEINAAPVPGAALALEGPASERVVAGSDGTFAALLAPGTWEVEAMPATGDAHARRTTVFAVGAVPQDEGDLPLPRGVRLAGTVTRATGATAVPNAEVRAEFLSSGFVVDRTFTRGDGSYTLYVPGGQTYRLVVSFDATGSLVDARPTVAVGATNTWYDVAPAESARARGVVRERESGTGLAGIPVRAMTLAGGLHAETRTCADGSFAVRVAATPGGYRLVASPAEVFAPQAWNGTPAGTPFTCEGTAVAFPAEGTEVSGLDFDLAVAATLEGTTFDQAGSRFVTVPLVSVDDGRTHACSLGTFQATGAGSWRVGGLPPSTVLPGGLRACTGTTGYAAQCFDMSRPPGWTAILAEPGETVADIDFWLGNRPLSGIEGLTIQRYGEWAWLNWTASADPYHWGYRIYGSTDVRPASGAGSFPTDPGFSALSTTTETSYAINVATPLAFFLVVDIGQGGAEGPAGAYQHFARSW